MRGVLYGVEVGVASGVAVGVASGVAVGVASGVAAGVASGVAVGVASGVAAGVASGVAVGVASGVAAGVASGVTVGVASGVAAGVVSGVAVGVLAGALSGVGAGVGVGVAVEPVSLGEQLARRQAVTKRTPLRSGETAMNRPEGLCMLLQGLSKIWPGLQAVWAGFKDSRTQESSRSRIRRVHSDRFSFSICPFQRLLLEYLISPVLDFSSSSRTAFWPFGRNVVYSGARLTEFSGKNQPCHFPQTIS